MSILTWRDVFDCYKLFGKVGCIWKMLEFLKTTGYKYMSWNGRILMATEDYTQYVELGTVEDLESGNIRVEK